MKLQGVIKIVNEAAAKVLGVNTLEGFCSWSLKVLTLLFFLAVSKVLKPLQVEVWVQSVC